MREDLPTGTVTFLFTDVEGSTRLLRELGPEAYADALADHRVIVRNACSAESPSQTGRPAVATGFALASVCG